MSVTVNAGATRKRAALAWVSAPVAIRALPRVAWHKALTTMSRMSEGAAALDGAPREPGWWAKLDGEEFDLQALADTLASDDLKLLRFESGFYLRSADFEGIEESGDVERRAKEIVRILNGAATVALGNHRPVRVDRVALVSEGGAVQHFVHMTGSLVARGRLSAVATTTGEQVREEVASPIERFARLGLADENVERALRILGSDDVDWRDLYFVFEVVETVVGGEMFRRGWASRAEEKRFTQTANSPGALGDAARHAREPTQPPVNPMTFAEGREFVRLLVSAWLLDVSA